MDVNEFQKIGADYLILNYSEYHEEIRAFRDANAAHLKLVKVFTPFWDPKRRVMMDVNSGTSAPDSQADLFSRERLGPYLEIYQIQK
jgi:hypothetical protein